MTADGHNFEIHYLLFFLTKLLNYFKIAFSLFVVKVTTLKQFFFLQILRTDANFNIYNRLLAYMYINVKCIVLDNVQDIV